MSGENVEIVRRRLRGVRQPWGGAGLIDEFLDPEIEWRGPREFPDLRRTAPSDTKASGVTWRRWAKPSTTIGWLPRSSSTRETIKSSCSLVRGEAGEGQPVPEVQSHPTAHLYTLRNGKAITNAELLGGGPEALEAAGLRE